MDQFLVKGGEYLNVPFLFPFSVKMLDAGG